jgi:hypothetical protein
VSKAVIAPKVKIGHNSINDAQGGDAMRKRKRFKQWKEFTSGTDRPKDERAKERMAAALAAYQGPITKCPPESAQRRVVP